MKELVFMVLLLLTAVLLILLVLVQRGKGGGLAGAFGGMGGQSAFGTKAGDLFTRITIGVVAFWILLCLASVKFMGNPESRLDDTMGGSIPVENGLGTAPSGDQASPGASDSGSADWPGTSSGTSGDSSPAKSTGDDGG